MATITTAVATITVPKEYGYVLATAASSMFLCAWHGMRVAPFRKRAKVPYPIASVSPEQIASASSPEQKQALHLFNCVQRAHYNFLENYIAVLPALLVAGLKYPLSTTGLSAVWIVFRVMYATGYTRADKENGKGRLVGSGFWLAQFGLFSLVGKMGWDLIMA